MTKEEIYERYWRQLVGFKRQFAGCDLDTDTRFLRFKKQLELERDKLLKKYGYSSFS